MTTASSAMGAAPSRRTPRRRRRRSCDATVACSDCGAIQRIEILDGPTVASCSRCSNPLERDAGRSMVAGFACALAAFALLIPANTLPVMRSHLAEASRDFRLIDGAIGYGRDGFPFVATVVIATIIVIPIIRAGLLSLVLGTLLAGKRYPWQGPFFRQAERFRLWSMLEVYLLGGAITYSRVAAQLEVNILVGGWSFIFATMLLLVAGASIDRAQVWRMIGPDDPEIPPKNALGCVACDLVLPAEHEGQRCPRCAVILRRRKTNSVERTVAFTAAALALMPAAYLLPMTRTMQPNGLMERTIFDGIHELFSRGFWYLGAMILIASVVIPVGKIIGLAWLTARVKWPSARGLRRRTRVHRIIGEINRWSMTDPFIVAVTVPMMAYPGIANTHPGPGTLPFTLVVVLTMIASHMFDTRLMWDEAEQNS